VLLNFQCTGIAVEFCSHIVRAYTVSRKLTKLLRSHEASSEMGSWVSVCFKKKKKQQYIDHFLQKIELEKALSTTLFIAFCSIVDYTTLI